MDARGVPEHVAETGHVRRSDSAFEVRRRPLGSPRRRGRSPTVVTRLLRIRPPSDHRASCVVDPYWSGSRRRRWRDEMTGRAVDLGAGAARRAVIAPARDDWGRVDRSLVAIGAPRSTAVRLYQSPRGRSWNARGSCRGVDDDCLFVPNRVIASGPGRAAESRRPLQGLLCTYAVDRKADLVAANWAIWQCHSPDRHDRERLNFIARHGSTRRSQSQS